MEPKCNYPVTEELLDLARALGCCEIALSTENRDRQGRVGHWDLVTLIDAQNVGFSVDSGEIVIRYFSDYVHFEKGEAAKTFLTRLFTCPLRRVQKYRGKRMAAEKYTLLLPDGQEISGSGWIWYRPLTLLNPFCRRRSVTETYQYDREKGRFTTTQPWQAAPEAVQTLSLGEKRKIVVLPQGRGYTYQIWYLEYDKEFGRYFWLPLDDGRKSVFDTQEKAVQAARGYLLPLRERGDQYGIYG